MSRSVPRMPKNINKSKRNSTPSYSETIYKYVKHQKLLLRKHPDFKEKWLQEKIVEDPSILGIGELILKDKERKQMGAARLDLPFQGPARSCPAGLVASRAGF